MLTAGHVCACMPILLLLTLHRDVIPLCWAVLCWAACLPLWSEPGAKTVISVSYWWWAHSLTSDTTDRHYKRVAVYRTLQVLNRVSLSKEEGHFRFYFPPNTITGHQTYCLNSESSNEHLWQLRNIYISKQRATLFTLHGSSSRVFGVVISFILDVWFLWFINL